MYSEELIVIILVLKIYRVYIESYLDIIIITNYKNLIIFIITKELVRR